MVVLRNGRVEEFDFESAARKLLRGNIYLAKVTRVEPSLQAGFIDYGGNRHGFLAFSEIHPDYYTIPVADRQALLDEEAAADAAEEAEADRRAEARAARGADQDHDDAEDHALDVTDLLPPETIEPIGNANVPLEATDTGDKVHSAPVEPTPAATETAPADHYEAPLQTNELHGDGRHDNHDHDHELGHQHAPATDQAGDDTAHHDEADTHLPVQQSTAEPVDSVGAEDALEELPARPRRRPRSYKIQEVIKRRQIILVQVVKEERGTKGAALTTYLSLAGRYTVLMPNTARGGGISRKITNAQDRKRLKAIAQDLDVPEGMGLIIRTAGAARTSQEIKRDFEYLLRLWESVRDMTLQSTAPSLVYEEGDLIKRSIRDLYTKEVDEIVVAGDAAHREARDFMRMLMPSHAKNVIDYREPEPLFNKYQIEKQLNAMFSPFVNLKSGGYLVINQTEALVAIDINSGKSTREFSIEETALNTNLEAADEIARQLKLRDLAGLIVIDFIDMEEKRNNRAVERRIKEALRFDRARIQVGRISHFGLLEMSRQRMRTGVLEGSTTQCPHCQGTGIIRSTESVALAVIRALEDTLIANGRSSLVATTAANVALYILNHKRNFIVDMEHRHGVSVTVQASDKMQGSNFTIEKSNLPLIAARRPDKAAVNMDWGFSGEGEAPAEEIEEIEAAVEADDASEARGVEENGNGEAPRGRRRRRRRGGRREDGGENGGDRNREPRTERNAVAEEDERPARLPTGELEEVGDPEDAHGDKRGRHSRSAEPRNDTRNDDSGEDGEVAQASERGERGERGDRPEGENGEGGRGRRGRRRGRRGGRRGGRDQENPNGGARAEGGVAASGDRPDDEPSADEIEHVYDAPREHQGEAEPHLEAVRHEPKPRRHEQPATIEAVETFVAVEAPGSTTTSSANGHHQAEPVEVTPHKPEPVAAREPERVADPKPIEAKPIERASTPPGHIAVVSNTPDEGQPARKGWWQRRFTGE
ncbi:MAG: Rne/Rng family ribonuclease [Hyphomicrobiaceae bacterium]